MNSKSRTNQCIKDMIRDTINQANVSDIALSEIKNACKNDSEAFKEVDSLLMRYLDEYDASTTPDQATAVKKILQFLMFEPSLQCSKEASETTSIQSYEVIERQEIEEVFSEDEYILSKKTAADEEAKKKAAADAEAKKKAAADEEAKKKAAADAEAKKKAAADEEAKKKAAADAEAKKKAADEEAKKKARSGRRG